jgi:LCP family protein required for cell wall assembly
VVLVLLVIAAVAGYLLYESHLIHRVHIKHLAEIRTSGAQKDVENILLIGSTTRCGLKKQNPAFGVCSPSLAGTNSDVVMILHLDPDHHRASILSIPRDTMIPNARHDGLNKIDAALGDPGGPSQLIAAITDDFGIPIQHYVELNFDSFQGVVGALGGLKMYFPMPVYDLESSLYIPTTGCVSLDGFQALAVVRARHLQYQPPSDSRLPRYKWPSDPQSDLSRIRRDHEFLRVLASEVAKRGLDNVVTDLRLINSLAGNLEVDQGLSAAHMANLVHEFHNMNPNKVPQYTLPVVQDRRAYYYRGGYYGDVVFPTQPEDARVVAQFLGTTLTEDSSGQPLPSPSSLTVAVENGSGVYEEGAKTSASLEALGYKVTSVTDTEVGASTTETTVLYSDPSKLADALRVQSALSGLAIIGYDPGLIHAETGRSGNPTSGTAGSGRTSSNSASSGTAGSTSTLDVGSPLPVSEAADVVLVVGSNFAVNPPAGSSPNSTPTSTTTPRSSSSSSGVLHGGAGSSASTTTVPAPLSNNPALAAPSSSTETLESWDPRSCTETGGDGP